MPTAKKHPIVPVPSDAGKFLVDENGAFVVDENGDDVIVATTPEQCDCCKLPIGACCYLDGGVTKCAPNVTFPQCKDVLHGTIFYQGQDCSQVKCKCLIAIDSLSPFPQVITGKFGGPFTPPSGTVVLRNDAFQPVAWNSTSVGLPTKVFTHSPTSGIIPAGGKQTVTITPNSLAASSSPGQYGTRFLFHMVGVPAADCELVAEFTLVITTACPGLVAPAYFVGTLVGAVACGVCTGPPGLEVDNYSYSAPPSGTAILTTSTGCIYENIPCNDPTFGDWVFIIWSQKNCSGTASSPTTLSAHLRMRVVLSPGQISVDVGTCVKNGTSCFCGGPSTPFGVGSFWHSPSQPYSFSTKVYTFTNQYVTCGFPPPEWGVIPIASNGVLTLQMIGGPA